MVHGDQLFPYAPPPKKTIMAARYIVCHYSTLSLATNCVETFLPLKTKRERSVPLRNVLMERKLPTVPQTAGQLSSPSPSGWPHFTQSSGHSNCNLL